MTQAFDDLVLNQYSSKAQSRIKRVGQTATGVREQKHILLIQDSLLRRECLEQALNARAGDFVVEGVAKIELASPKRPDLILLDIKSAWTDEPWIRDVAAEVRQRHRDVPMMAIADRADRQSAIEALGHGFRGYIPTSHAIEVVIAAIRLVLAGGSYVPTELLGHRADVQIEAAATQMAQIPNDDLQFTSREFEVVEQLKQGKPNKIIAYQLNISESTVKVHMRNIMRKLRATNRTQVAYLTRAQIL